MLFPTIKNIVIAVTILQLVYSTHCSSAASSAETIECGAGCTSAVCSGVGTPINNSNSSATATSSSNTCDIICDQGSSCAAATLSCHANNTRCTIHCVAKKSCEGALVNVVGVGDGVGVGGDLHFTIICNANAACITSAIHCGSTSTAMCDLRCGSAKDDCKDATVNALDAQLFSCTDMVDNSGQCDQIAVIQTPSPTATSAFPTSYPSIVPTAMPSSSITNPNTVNPSSNPSFNPSSNNPSFNPSSNPSFNPSSNPSFNPSSNPSFNPSSTNPSFNPSSNNPSSSNPSSSIPSFNPSSSHPTFVPTLVPTFVPSNTPSSMQIIVIPTTTLAPTAARINSDSRSPTSVPSSSVNDGQNNGDDDDEHADDNEYQKAITARNQKAKQSQNLQLFLVISIGVICALVGVFVLVCVLCYFSKKRISSSPRSSPVAQTRNQTQIINGIQLQQLPSMSSASHGIHMHMHTTARSRSLQPPSQTYTQTQTQTQTQPQIPIHTAHTQGQMPMPMPMPIPMSMSMPMSMSVPIALTMTIPSTTTATMQSIRSFSSVSTGADTAVDVDVVDDDQDEKSDDTDTETATDTDTDTHTDTDTDTDTDTESDAESDADHDSGSDCDSDSTTMDKSAKEGRIHRTTDEVSLAVIGMGAVAATTTHALPRMPVSNDTYGQHQTQHQNQNQSASPQNTTTLEQQPQNQAMYMSSMFGSVGVGAVEAGNSDMQLIQQLQLHQQMQAQAHANCVNGEQPQQQRWPHIADEDGADDTIMTAGGGAVSMGTAGATMAAINMSTNADAGDGSENKCGDVGDDDGFMVVVGQQLIAFAENHNYLQNPYSLDMAAAAAAQVVADDTADDMAYERAPSSRTQVVGADVKIVVADDIPAAVAAGDVTAGAHYNINNNSNSTNNAEDDSSTSLSLHSASQLSDITRVG